VRVFAALPLPPQAVARLSGVFAALKRAHPRLRFTKPMGMHVTLHFFGELPEEAVAELRSLWEDPALLRPFVSASFDSVGCFPQKGNPRVVWIGIRKGREELEEYSRAFQSLISRLGYREDPRGFTPHVTLARNDVERISAEQVSGIPVPEEEFFFQGCVLFQSVLTPRGAEYMELRRAAFTGGGTDEGG
jgi:2'-5' RNA ligase